MLRSLLDYNTFVWLFCIFLVDFNVSLLFYRAAALSCPFFVFLLRSAVDVFSRPATLLFKCRRWYQRSNDFNTPCPFCTIRLKFDYFSVSCPFNQLFAHQIYAGVWPPLHWHETDGLIIHMHIPHRRVSQIR